ncbi:transposase [Chitinispirillum alkaliphilum]|nr:transposase [Chitinispirillum alkaliphilum]
MPREARISLPGEIHHVMSRGIGTLLLFRDDWDRECFLTKVEQVISESDCECYGFALMGNHYHLILRPNSVSISNIMQRINGSYARNYNIKYGRNGYVFGDRFKSTVAQEYWYIRELIRYVHLNPIRANICSDINELAEYPWTGHASLMGSKKRSLVSVHNVLEKFGDRLSIAREHYLDWVRSAKNITVNDWYTEIRPFHPENPEEEKLFHEKRVKGSIDFVRKTINHAKKSEIVLKDIINRPELPDLLKSICMKKQIPPEIIMKKGRQCVISEARAKFCKDAIEKYGYSVIKTAEFLMVNASTVSRLMKKRLV